jgi:anti-sigma regulatory factor (Ser/Thr protein kinase)
MPGADGVALEAVVAGKPQSLSIVSQADSASLSVVRERVTSWLERVDWPAGDQYAAIFVVNEAVTNAIEHGFGWPPHRAPAGGCVWVQVDIEPSDSDHRRLVIAVTDNGGWKQPSKRRFGDRLGLLVMGRLGEDLWVDGRPDGTTLVFTGHPQRGTDD